MTSSAAAYSAGCVGRSSSTLLTTSAHGDRRSTSTPLATFTGSAGAYGSVDSASHRRLPLTLGACLHTASSPPPACVDTTGHATPPHLAASTGGGGRFSPGAPGATASTASAVYFTEEEIARLRALLVASDSIVGRIYVDLFSCAPDRAGDCASSMPASSILRFSIDRFCWFYC